METINRIKTIKWEDWNAYEGPMMVFERVQVAGVTHVNDDGVSRQEILARMQRWETIDLVRDLKNKHDDYAVGVYGGMGQIGYIKQPDNRHLARLIDKGCTTLARMSSLHGGKDGKNYGCALEVHVLFPEGTTMLYDAKVVGVSGKNDMGDSRAEIAEEVEAGDIAMLDADYGKNDDPVVTVDAGPGDIGRLAKPEAAKIHGLLMDGKFCFAKIAEALPEIKVTVAVFP
ncbi:MAG: hypothetical protein EOM37_12970 [Proteobacteria bacterium]|nr:hypothetical protein [Pseudomonadota bacterium]